MHAETAGRQNVTLDLVAERATPPLPDEREDRAATGDFMVAFTKAVLKTGYYAPGHPEAEKARAGLFFALDSIVQRRGQLSITVVQSGDHQLVIIGGVFDEPISLAKLIRHSGAEIFTPKVVDLLSSKGVFSISFHRGITDGQFRSFMDLLSQATPGGRVADDGAGFVASLAAAGVSAVSVIPVSEVRRHKRRISWRAQIVLSHLGRDLRKVPIIQTYTPAQVAALYTEVIREIFRPVKDASLIRDAILNLDLVLNDLTDMAGIDVVAAVTRAVPHPLLSTVLPSLIILRNGKGQRAGTGLLPEQEDVARRAAMVMIDRIITADDPASYPLLEQLFQARLVRFEYLPVRLKTRIASGQITERYRAAPDAFLGRLAECAGRDDLCPNLVEGFVAAAYLLRTGTPAEAAPLLRALFNVRDATPRRSELFDRAFETGLSLVRTDENLAALKPLLSSPVKTTRVAAIEAAGYLGAAAMGALLDTLRASPDRWVRKSAIDSLTRLGEAVIPDVERALLDPAESWYMKRNMLAILTATGEASRAAVAEPLRNHAHPRVREAALEAMVALQHVGSEQALIEALDDPSENVRRRAIALLVALGHSSPRLIATLQGLLAGTGADKAGEGMQLASVQAVCDLIEDPTIPDGTDPEKILIDALGIDRGLLDRVFSRLTRGGRPAVRAAIADCLGRYGSERALSALDLLARDRTPAVAETARKALGRMKARRTVSQRPARPRH